MRDFELFEVLWCPQNQIELVWGVMVMFARFENHEHEGFSSFPKLRSKSY